MGTDVQSASGRVEELARLRWLGLALQLGFAGTLLHDLIEFGVPSAENTLPAGLLFSALFLVWWRLPRARRAAEVVLLVLAAIMILGGAVASVLPLPVWPFEPEQTLAHYAAHLGWLLGLLAMASIIIYRVRRPEPGRV